MAMKPIILPLFAALLAFPFAAPAGEPPDVPRLSGIVSLPGTKQAVFEFPDNPWYGPRQLILREADGLWGLKVLKILPDRRSVEVRVDGADAPLTLTLKAGSNAPPSAAASIELDNARLLSVLELYGQFSDRTLLYWPSLPSLTLSLRADPHTPGELAQLLKETLATNRVAAIADGEKFEMMVPADQAKLVQAHPPSPNARGTERPGQKKPHEGMIDFYGADLVQVFDIYALMIGGQFDRTAPTPSVEQPFIWLHTKPGLSEQDGLYALDTLFGWRGIKMVRGTNGLVRAVQEPRK
jgi:hypothetical protein